MRRFPALLLLILPALAHGQLGEQIDRSLGQQVVEANEIDVGLGTRLLQAASLAFNPRQENTRWPLFAYSFDDVLSTRTCDSFGDIPAGDEFAFVSAASDVEMMRKLIGVQVDEAEEIRDVCTRIADSPSAFADELNALLLDVEAQAASLQHGVIAALDDIAPAQDQLNRQCMTPFLSGTAHHAGSASSGPTEAMAAGEPGPAHWRGVVAEARGSIITIDWTGIDSREEEILHARRLLEESGYTAPIWHFRPDDAHHVAGMFFLTGRNSSAQTPFETVDTSWNDGQILWMGMPISENGPPVQFTMWYAPPFCSEGDELEWYLVSERPLQIISSDFRTNMFSLDAVVRDTGAELPRASID